MKKKEMNKKLELNKKTIANLDRIEMNVIHGGILTTKPQTICDCTGDTCATCENCETEAVEACG
jgi:hypothetical protein